MPDLMAALKASLDAVRDKEAEAKARAAARRRRRRRPGPSPPGRPVDARRPARKK